MKIFICFLLVFSFVVCVYSYGTNNRFSIEVYLNNLSNSLSEFPSLQGLVEIWDSEPEGSIHGGGPGWAGDSEGNRPSDEELGFWDRCYDFFKNIGSFFSNVWDSILYLLDILIAVFDTLVALLPWYSTVPKEV